MDPIPDPRPPGLTNDPPATQRVPVRWGKTGGRHAEQPPVPTMEENLRSIHEARKALAHIRSLPSTTRTRGRRPRRRRTLGGGVESDANTDPSLCNDTDTPRCNDKQRRELVAAWNKASTASPKTRIHPSIQVPEVAVRLSSLEEHVQVDLQPDSDGTLTLHLSGKGPQVAAQLYTRKDPPPQPPSKDQQREELVTRWNDNLDQLERTSSAGCLLRGIDSQGALYALEAPTTAARRSRATPLNHENQLLLYSAVATASTWDGKSLADAPVMRADPEEQERWEAQFNELSPRQRRKRWSGGNSRVSTGVRVMIDSGASRNFISQSMVREHQLTTHRTSHPLTVCVADGVTRTVERAVLLTLDFGGYRYTKPFYVFPLDLKVSVIVGTPFLHAISPFMTDLKTDPRTIQFWTGGKRVTLEATPDTIKGTKLKVITLKEFLKEQRVRLRLHKSAGENEALAYVCILSPSKADDADTEKGEKGADPVTPTPPPEPPPDAKLPPEPPPAAKLPPLTTEQATAQLKLGTPHNVWTTLPAATSAKVRARLQDLLSSSRGGKDPAICLALEKEIQKLASQFETLGETFWTTSLRDQLALYIQAEFESMIKEDMPIRDGPAVDNQKAPASIRFKESYNGETPHRGGIKMAPVELQQCREALLDLLAKGYIRPSSSPFGAPILMVPKPGSPGKMRMVVDYRGINALTQSDRYPLPTIDCLLQTMAGAKIFSTVDMLSGFWQIPLLPEHQERSAMTTSMFGSFEWLVMPMGLKNSPSHFQRSMAELLRDLPFAQVYIDDVVCFSQTVEEHHIHLHQVMERLRDGGISVKQSKAKLYRTSIDFLGHVVSGDGVSPQKGKVSAVADWPTPTTVPELRSFLGLASYYRRYMYRFAAIATPLHALLKDDTEWQWRPEVEQKAFDTLKETLTTAPLLVLPDTAGAMSGERPFLVQTDASGAAWGGVLSQDQGKGQQPIAFVSRSMTPAEVNYSATERELLGLVKCTCEEWRHFLFGCHYTLQGDHRPLQWLLDPSRELTRRQARWIDMLMEGDVPTMEWVPGKTLIVPDALSRRADLMRDTPSAREGLVAQPLHPAAPGVPVPDPEETVRVVDPLIPGYQVLPDTLKDAPRAAGQEPEAVPKPCLPETPVQEPTPGLSPSTETMSRDNRPLQRSALLKESELLQKAARSQREGAEFKATCGTMLTEDDESELLQKATRCQQEGAGFEATCAVCMTEDDDLCPESRDDYEEDFGWLPISEANGLLHCLPSTGTGSVSHATDTLLLLLYGRPLPAERERPEVPTLPARSVTPTLHHWGALCALEELVDQGITPVDQRTSELLRRDQQDWQLVTGEFQRWQHQLGPFQVDACCDPQGRNRQAVQGERHWFNCLSQAWDGLSVWCNPPFQRQLCLEILQHFQRAQTRDPTSSATFVLPTYLAEGPLAEQLGQMRGLTIRHRYPTGTLLFFAADGTLLPSLWEVCVYHSPGQAPIAADPIVLAPLAADTAPPPRSRSSRIHRCHVCQEGTGTRQGQALHACTQCGRFYHSACRPEQPSGRRRCTLCDDKEQLARATPAEGVQDIDSRPVPVQLSLLGQLKKAAPLDPHYQECLRVDNRQIFRTMGELLWRVEGGGLQLVIPNDPALKDTILKECHSSASAGHMGSAKTWERVSRRFWWPGCRTDVLDYVHHCDSYQRCKPLRKAKPNGLLHPVPIPHRRFEVISCDFVIGIPETKEGHNAILTITDAEGIARLFVDNW